MQLSPIEGRTTLPKPSILRALFSLNVVAPINLLVGLGFDRVDSRISCSLFFSGTLGTEFNSRLKTGTRRSLLFVSFDLSMR